MKRLTIFGVILVALLFSHLAYSQPSLIAPENNADLDQNTTTSVQFEWSSVSGASDYEIQVATDPGFGTSTVVKDDVTTATTETLALENSEYYSWRVASIDQYNDKYWSTSYYTFILDIPPIISSYTKVYGYTGASSIKGVAAGYGCQIAIHGMYFGEQKNNQEQYAYVGNVLFPSGSPLAPTGGVFSGTIVSWKDDDVVCDIPPLASSGPVIVSTSLGSANVPGESPLTPTLNIDWSYYGVRFDAPADIAYEIQNETTDSQVSLSTEEQGINEAAGVWATDNTDAQFNLSQEASSPWTIGFVDDSQGLWHNYTDYAETAYETSPTSGKITTFFTMFNPTYSYASEDVETVALHEFGHWAGLQDLWGITDEGKVMYANPQGQVHSLTQSDLDGVQSVYGVGHVTGVGGTPSPDGLPTPPAVQASVSGQSVVLTWTDQEGDAYSVYKDNQELNGGVSLSGTTDTYTDPSGASSLPVTYTVEASNSAGSTVSLPVTMSSSTITSNTIWQGIVYTNGDVTVNSGYTLIINNGTTIRISPGSSIIDDGTIEAEGQSYAPIVFKQATSGDLWNEIQLNGNNNSFTDCVFDGGATDVYVYEGSGDSFTDCTFENASGDGLLIQRSGSSIDNCTFEHNGIGIDLGYDAQTTSINQSTISDNTGVGLYMISGTISDFTNNAIENNGSYGIDIEGGILYMGNGTTYYSIGSNPVASSAPTGAGKNRIDNNGSSQIYVDTGGEVYVGDLESGYSLRDGFNSVTSSSTYYIYNLAMTQSYESEEQWPVPAADTYWGGSVGSENFYGTVNYYTYQLLTPPSSAAGATSTSSTNTGQYATIPVGDKTPATLMTAAMATKISKDLPSSGMGQFFVNLKNRMMQVINDINNPKMALTHPRMIGYLNSLCSFDTNDVTGERGAVQDLLTSYYKELPAGNFSDTTSRLCSEAALVAEVQNEVNSGQLDSAETLMNEYGKYVKNNDNQRTLLFNQMEIDQQHNQDGEALGVLKQIEAFKPDSRQKKGYEAPDYSVIASLLGEGAGSSSQSQSKEVSSAQTQQLPTKFELLQNYPNPFNPTTTIDYDLATPANVRLIVYAVTGQEVAVLESGNQAAGSHQAIFNGGRFASGVYFVRLVAQGQNGRQYIRTIKMLELK